MTAAAATALAIGGCGEIKNTITPSAGSANQVTVVLAGAPNALYAGIYEAQALGYFRQTDMVVHIKVPTAGQNPVDMVHNGQALIAIASEPTVLLHRNEDEPVVGIGAIVHGPLSSISVPVPAVAPSGGAGIGTASTTAATATTTTLGTGVITTTATTAPTVTRTTTTATGTATSTGTTTTSGASTTLASPDQIGWPAQLQQLLTRRGAPTYDGLVIVVRKGTIVDDAPLPRRFVQAVARGYRAARANPAQAIAALVKAVPSLAPSRALQLSALKAAMPDLFPAGDKIWGWQSETEWNKFGTWLTDHHLLSNPNAVTDAATNELLQGEGV